MIKNVLTPDNVNIPENMSIHIESINNKIVLHFEGVDNMNKLIPTIDEVLEHIQVSLKVTEEC